MHDNMIPDTTTRPIPMYKLAKDISYYLCKVRLSLIGKGDQKIAVVGGPVQRDKLVHRFLLLCLGVFVSQPFSLPLKLSQADVFFVDVFVFLLYVIPLPVSLWRLLLKDSPCHHHCHQTGQQRQQQEDWQTSLTNTEELAHVTGI